MPRLSLSKAWDDTREIVARDGKLLLAVVLALVLLPQAIAGVAVPPPNLGEAQPESWTDILIIASAFFAIAGQLALVRLVIGPQTSVGGAIGHGFRRLPAAIGSFLLLILGVSLLMIPILAVLAAIGAVTLPQPGAAPEEGAAVVLIIVLVLLLVSARFMLLVPILSAESAGPISALKRSWQLSKGHYARLIAFLLAMIAAAVLLFLTAQMIGGILARLAFGSVDPWSVPALILALFMAGVQAIFTMVATVMLTRLYAQLAGEAEPASVPHAP